MSALHSSRATPPPALQTTVLIRTPLATRPIPRINDTPHWRLGTRYRSSIAAHCASLVKTIAILTAARHSAIAQIPITHRFD
jgi:hypothetical protein